MFVVTTLLLLAQLFWVCESRTQWKNLPNPQCGLPQQVAIFTDIISDAILLFAPWPLFRSLVDKSLGHKLTIIFSTCLATTFVSLSHATFILKDDDIRIPFSGIAEGCLSLIVANIPVIITTTIDIVGQPDSRETAEFSTIFWLGNTDTTGTMELEIIGEVYLDARTLPCRGDMSSKEKFSKGVGVSVESIAPI
ncbi:hypothetical protein B0H12DRAFT_1160677 [Mycena haematopus]|nr:hypothetical protein B0H12DRAFT_1160677 [Mycena haematopus]